MMRQRQMARHTIDMAMIILLPLLMMEMLTGQEMHEWLGACMIALFAVHHILNLGWWKGFCRGKYTPARALGTTLNLLLLADTLALAISGIMMSSFVFAFLHVDEGMIIARQLHLLASYWGLILMSVHLGLHLGPLTRSIGKTKGSSEGSAVKAWSFRIIAIAGAVYGAYAFFAQHIGDYLFLQTHFVLFDETKTPFGNCVEIIAVVWLFAWATHGLSMFLSRTSKERDKHKTDSRAWKALSLAIPVTVCVLMAGRLMLPSQSEPWKSDAVSSPSPVRIYSESGSRRHASIEPRHDDDQNDALQDGFVFVQGGGFVMGSAEEEPWRSDDEAQHTVIVGDFYVSPYEVKQSDYVAVMGESPFSFSGDNLPAENVSWLDAVAYCNALSVRENLTPAYRIDGQTVTWDRTANGYRLPTEAEWEYACRAGTTTPFNTETSISPEEANYYGHYPYEIENNYFSQGHLSTKPGEYRQTTVDVDSFSPNSLGLYNMHGNVSEWVWDYYGEYNPEDEINPTGPTTGTRRVYRGGGWNDFAKNTRSAYRGALPEDHRSFSLGIRLVRNAADGTDNVVSTEKGTSPECGGKTLIAFFSWGGNTRGIAEEIASQTEADLFEIELEDPYSSNYNTVLDQAQHDQSIQARPAIRNHIEDFDQYDTILLGYPNWWASIPMPIASLLEEYDFSGKTIIPFCSHGGGRFGQSLTAIAKLAPDAIMGEPLSIHYSGGSALPQDVAEWLERNRIQRSLP